MTESATGEERMAEGPEEPDKPFGPAAAAFLAAGVGAFVLGLLTTLAEASETIAERLEFSTPVGPLSGKTSITVGVWLVAWLVLHLALRGRDPASRTIYWATGILVLLGLLGTFPIFFEAFAPPE